MVKAHSHMSQTREKQIIRHFAVLDRASLLLLWLNERRGTSAYRRVTGLLNNISQYLQAVKVYRGAHPDKGYLAKWGMRVLPGALDFPTEDRDISSAARAINASLRRYKLRPEFDIGKGGRLWFEWEPANSKEYNSPKRIGNQLRFSESHAIARIVDLCHEGIIERVRECQSCGKWFGGKFSHSKFCSTQCQQSHYRANPEWKEYRRQYMRRLRILHQQKAPK